MKLPKQPNQFFKYSNMAIQMAVIITLGAFFGKWLDAKFILKYPVFTILLSLISIFAAMYLSLKDFINKK